MRVTRALLSQVQFNNYYSCPFDTVRTHMETHGGSVSRVVIFSLEFLGPVFSGNGQYSRCIVRSLQSAGVNVLIVSGKPNDVPLEASLDPGVRDLVVSPNGVVDISIPRWGQLERGCGWREFVRACHDEPRVALAVDAFGPQAVICVDFHTPRAWKAVEARLLGLGKQGDPADKTIPMIWMNFRVFAESTALHSRSTSERSGAEDEDSLLGDAEWYAKEEAAAIGASALTIALCRADALNLCALTAGRSLAQGSVPAAAAAYQRKTPPRLAILLPPLRGDVEALARSVLAGSAQRPPRPSGMNGTATAGGGGLITSIVRISPEKNAAAGIDLLTACSRQLESLSLQPLIVGANGADAEYVAKVRRAAASLPGVLLPPPLDAHGLSAAFAAAAINIHPCLADAYGMTIVEAAAWGVPSVVHCPAGAHFQNGAAGGSPQILDFVPLESAYGAWNVAVSKARLDEEWADQLARECHAQAATLPPVGACDLLAPSPYDASSSPGVVAWDWSRAPGDMKDDFCAVLADASALRDARLRGISSLQPSRLEAIAVAGQTRALEWSEKAHGLALRKFISDAIDGAI